MKKLNFLLAVLAVALVFAIVSCTNETGDDEHEQVTYIGMNGDATYVLTISPSDDRAVHRKGDDYMLLVTRSSGSKTSSGKVKDVNGNIFVLQPSTENASDFTVTLSGAAVSRIDGNITFVTGPSEIGPGSFDGGSDTTPTPTTYTMTYNRNNGSGTVPAAQTVNAGSSVTLASGSGLSRSGYSFGGWNTNSSGTGTNYSAGTSYTPTASITLYAKWDSSNPVVTTYTVTYNANGGSGSVASQTVNAGSSVTLPSGSGLSRSGYSFGGWNTNTSGTGTNYSAGTSYTPTASVTLYAKWTSTSGGTTSNPFLGTWSGVDPYGDRITVVISAASWTATNPDTGFSRTGTYTYNGNTGNLTEPNGYTGTGTVSGNTLTVSISGLGTMTLTKGTGGNSSTVSLSGKYLDDEIPEVYYDFNSNGTFTMTIFYEVISGSYTVSGSTVVLRYQGYEDDEDNNLTIVNSTTLRDTNGNLFIKGGTGGGSTYSISYHPNGGIIETGYVYVARVNIGSSVTLASGSGLSRSGYSFVGWNTNAAGTGTTYLAGSSYTPTGDITLYAKWSR